VAGDGSAWPLAASALFSARSSSPASSGSAPPSSCPTSRWWASYGSIRPGIIDLTRSSCL
jgi:hypothetical protein